ncbi:Putative oxidoreductase OS=Bosea thiooxidans OX=53254 GN=SAMN05660750_04658 PE=3 SV=1 [Bosea thiooxidans]
MQVLSRFSPYTLGLLRIFAALTSSRMARRSCSAPGSAVLGMPAMLSLPWTAGLLEIVGGALVLVGFLTRPAAFVLSGMMAVAYGWPMARRVYPLLNGGEAAMLFCFIFLYIATAGPGAFAIEFSRG